MTDRDARLHALARSRWSIAITLTALVVVTYFGFIALVAFRKPLLGRQVTPGLSLGILLGALVIVVSWLLTWAYVSWANRRYDVNLAALRSDEAGDARAAREAPSVFTAS